MASTGTARMRPRDVPGYAEALATGRVRPVPASPPSLLPGPSASRIFVGFLVATAVTVVVYFIAFAVVKDATGSPGGARAAIMVPLGLAAFALIIWMLRRVGRRNLEELANGYTTIRLTLGGFSLSLRRFRSPQQRRVMWDYSGLWVLDGRSGRVLSAPAPQADPPGYFPSPHRPGALELWSGAQWTGEFR